jgi:hypothetical protein
LIFFGINSEQCHPQAPEDIGFGNIHGALVKESDTSSPPDCSAGLKNEPAGGGEEQTIRLHQL